MSVNGIVITKTVCECSQCGCDVYKCDNCEEFFIEGDFISCGDDDKHVCEQCYEDFGPKAINPEATNG